jgi:hypothetical protein
MAKKRAGSRKCNQAVVIRKQANGGKRSSPRVKKMQA